jgi:uncharacterized membrane protein YedE/YeeE
MKQRILTGWTFRRVLYVALGALLIAQSIEQKLWFGVLFGGYFASMGLFAFGCASGNCFGGRCDTTPLQKSKTKVSEIEFEELKKN